MPTTTASASISAAQACIAPFNKEPEKYIQQLEAAGVELDTAPVAAEKTGHEGHNH